ncbi:hypothetical protein BJ742DRAFT_849958 [Cladochytrium replicatum]|nr:hypothetical protein BJ742DRAFT_849958 [Cladochytrium replicatum]
MSYPINEISVSFAFVSSVVSIGTLIVRHAVVRPQMIARELLVTSMLVSGLINSVNSVSSGFVVITTGKMPPRGSAQCTTSGFVRQWSLQSLDFTLLAITLTTSSVLMQKTNVGIMDVISKYIWVILGCCWGVSLGTATAAHFVIGYAPSGAWCWIAGTPLPLATYARYGLTHGPRIAIFVTMIICYCMLFFVLFGRRNQLLKALQKGNSTGEASSESNSNHATGASQAGSHTNRGRRFSGTINSVTSTMLGQGGKSLFGGSSKGTNRASTTNNTSGAKKDDRLFRSMVLLALYPVTYIVLWAPGIVNRLYESLGIVNNDLVLLQSFSLLQPAANCTVWLMTQFLRKRRAKAAEPGIASSMVSKAMTSTMGVNRQPAIQQSKMHIVDFWDIFGDWMPLGLPITGVWVVVLAGRALAVIQQPAASAPLPIDWTSTAQVPPSINYNQDFSGCPCDLTAMQCDARCCCDPDCSLPEQIASFPSEGCLPGSRITNTKGLVPMCAQGLVSVNARWWNDVGATAAVSRGIDGALCVLIANSPVQGDFYEDPGTVDTDSAFNEQLEFNVPYSYSGTSYDVDQSENVPITPYRVGDPVQTIIYGQPSIPPQPMNLPFPDSTGQCDDETYFTRFQNNEWLSCSRTISGATDCVGGGPLDIDYYTGAKRVIQDPSNTTFWVPITVNSTRCFSKDLGTLTDCSSGTGPSWMPATLVCRGIVMELSLTFQYEITAQNTTSISGVSADVVLLDSNPVRGGEVAVTQTFSVQYVETNGTVTYSRSGNPGYLDGYPVLAGSLVQNGESGGISYSPDPYSSLSLPNDFYNTANNRLECPDPGDMLRRVPVTFSEDTIAGCTLHLTYDEVTKRCSDIRQQAYNVLTLTASKVTHVGRFGNASVENVWDWIRVINTVPSSIIQDSLNDSTPGLCSPILTEFNIQILTARFGSQQMPQRGIVGARFNYIPGRLRFPCTVQADCAPGSNVTKTFFLRATVTFAEIAGQEALMFVPPPPRLIPPLPDDIFYPFRIFRSGAAKGNNVGFMIWVATGGLSVYLFSM